MPYIGATNIKHLFEMILFAIIRGFIRVKLNGAAY